MSTITVILEPDADGTLHLPLPEELRHGKVRVEASLEAAEQAPSPAADHLKGFGALKGKIFPTPETAPEPGSLKGFWMAPDFDEALEDFKEYME